MYICLRHQKGHKVDEWNDFHLFEFFLKQKISWTWRTFLYWIKIKLFSRKIEKSLPSSKSKLALLHIFRESNQISENVDLTEFLSNNRLRDCEWVIDLYFITKSKLGNNMHLWSEWNWWIIVGTSVRIIYASIHRFLNTSRILLALIWEFSFRFILSVLK